MKISYDTVDICECVGYFEDEYVYDLELDNNSKIFFANDILIHNSIVTTIQPILEKLNKEFLIDDDINPVVYDIAQKIKVELDTKINIWAKDELKSDHDAYEFKRENISSSGAFLTKKHYILNIRDDDDKKVDKFQYKGVEVVKTSTPKKIKPLIKYTIETLIKKGDIKQIEAILQDTYNKYQDFEVEDIAVPISLNGYAKYSAMSSGFTIGKHTPVHVKGAIYYNLLLNKLQLDKKYESLKGGDKIKMVYLLPNEYDIKVISFIHNFPEELKAIFKPDKDVMFEKTVLKPVKRVFDAINWEVRNPLLQEKVDILDMFGT